MVLNINQNHQKTYKTGCNIVKRKGSLLLWIYQYWIFHHTVIKTCFEILKSSEHEKLCRYSNYKSLNVLKIDQLIPQFHFTIKLLRIGGPGKIDVYKYCIRTRLEPVFDVLRVCHLITYHTPQSEYFLPTFFTSSKLVFIIVP